MILSVRKSLNIGPFRVTFSKSGVTVSSGITGLRASVKSDGKATLSASKYGLSWRKSKKIF